MRRPFPGPPQVGAMGTGLCIREQASGAGLASAGQRRDISREPVRRWPGQTSYLPLVAIQVGTGAMAACSLPLEKTVWSVTPATATSLRLAKSALRLSGTRSAVSARSALNCSSSAVLPWAADSGRSVAPVACSEIFVHASAALEKLPKGPDVALGLGVAEAEAVDEAAADDGALPAWGAEQPVRTRAARNAAAAVRGRAIFFEITLQNHFSVEIAPPARTGLPAALVFFPQRASLARPAVRPPTGRRRRCSPGLPVDCSVTAVLTPQKGACGAVDGDKDGVKEEKHQFSMN